MWTRGDTAGLASAAGAGASAGIPQAMTMTSATAAQMRPAILLFRLTLTSSLPQRRNA